MSPSDLNKETLTQGVVSNEISEKRYIVELKNGKVVFKQKPLSFDKLSDTMQETVKFREMLEQRIERQEPPLIVFPEEHKPLIAKLAHESDKSLATLAKHIRAELLPAQDEDEDNTNSGSTDVSTSLPLSIIESAIKSVLNRNNYGIDSPSGGGKLPSGLCVWRWEAKEEYRDWLPKAAREKADGRLAERIQAKKDLKALFEALSRDEQDVMLDPKATTKLPTKDINKPAGGVSPTKTIESESKDSPQGKKHSKQQTEDAENDASDAPTPKSGGSRPKKDTDPEKLAREKERLEKKAAKAEKEKKEKDAQLKSRSIMANFFGKPKTSSARASPVQEPDLDPAGPSTSQSEFERTFKPFVVKKDAEIAPTNWFLHAKTNSAHRRQPTYNDNEIIIIDDDVSTRQDVIDVDMRDIQQESLRDVNKMGIQEHVAFVLSSFPSSADPSFTTAPRRKLSTPRHNTRIIISQLSEAEIADNPSHVRSLLSILRNRSVLPAKVIVFVEDARPGYYGTWTRHSQIIGPRRPFARDLVALDYAYDSGEEWEDEAGGDDVVEGAEDEDADGATEADSDLDSWLVDDDDVEEVGTPLEEREADDLPPILNFPSKRKAEEGERKIGKKRKVVVPLVPFAKGPCWESDTGECSYEPFQLYRIQLFNDTPYPINPFTFISTPLEKPVKASKETSSTSPTFAVPSLPDRLLSTSSSSSTPPLLSNVNPASGLAVKRTTSAPAPKTSFPDAHLPVLISKIAALKTSNLTFLVESIHQDLRTHKIKKNAIEAKIKEIGEKCKEKKIWVIKSSTIDTIQHVAA